MRIFLFILSLLFICQSGITQIETHWIDTTTYQERELAYFFTNRKVKKTDDGSVDFRNRWTRRTGNLYFCRFDYKTDSIFLKYQATQTCGKHVYPTTPVENNIFYNIYLNLRIKEGIKRFIFIVPGYGKTFHKQVYNYMHRLQKQYADSLQAHTAFITFAWGTQSLPLFYYKGKRSANRAADDFAIFQHMLEDFLADSAFFSRYPYDVKLNLVCMSMGNQLLKRYMIKREKQGIDYVPVYEDVVFIGSDAADDSFEEGKGFFNLHQMADSVLVFVNRKDGPLTMSQWLNLKTRMGLGGPRNLETLPDNVLILDITNTISWQDLPAMGHDYFLRNEELMEAIRVGLSDDESP